MNPLILPFKPKNCIVEFEPHCKPAPSATNLYGICFFIIRLKNPIWFQIIHYLN